MNAIKGIKLIAALIVAATAAGCASLGDGNGNGGSHDTDNVVAQMQGDSRGK